MTKKELEVKWDEIFHSNRGEFEYKLLSTNSAPLLNIGYSKTGERCLLLELPRRLVRKFPLEERENISLKYFVKEHCLCMILSDVYFSDLFDDLILSTYAKTAFVTDPEKYADVFVTHFFKWTAFFDNLKSEELSYELVKGIFGELIFLRELITSEEFHIDEVLIAWRGPYDEGHDFVMEFIDYEIKTLEEGKNTLQISSEYQLDNDLGKSLELVVISVKTDSELGVTLGQIFNELKNLIYEHHGDYSIFLKALAQKGLNSNVFSSYDNYRFIPQIVSNFDATSDLFPRLIPSELSDQIFNVNYSIRLSLLEPFLLNKKNIL